VASQRCEDCQASQGVEVSESTVGSCLFLFFGTVLIMVAAMNNSNNQNVDHDTRASPPKDRVSDQ